MSVLALLIASWLFFMSYQKYSEESALASRGKPAVVDPIREYTEITKMRSGNKRIEATLTFKTAEGVPVSVKREIPEEVLARFASGQPVTITYVPANPRITSLPGERPHVGGFMIVLGIVLLGYAAWKALSSGTAASSPR